jgi:hypothetical protein
LRKLLAEKVLAVEAMKDISSKKVAIVTKRRRIATHLIDSLNCPTAGHVICLI